MTYCMIALNEKHEKYIETYLNRWLHNINRGSAQYKIKWSHRVNNMTYSAIIVWYLLHSTRLSMP